MKVHLTRVIRRCLVASAVVAATAGRSDAAGPVAHAHFEPDYEASGFVTPAGMPTPDQYFRGVDQAGFFNGPIAGRLRGGVAYDGVHGDVAGGHGYAYADPSYADPAAGGYPLQWGEGGAYGYGPEVMACDPADGCGMFGCGPGLLGGPGLACGHAAGRGGCLARLRGLCMFCGGSGCGVCQSIGQGYLLGALSSLLPHGEAGLAAQRWYDLSADVMFLQVSGGTSSQVLTTRGAAGVPVLLASDADDNSYAAGGRISGAFICGPGGNVEVTYLGGNRWEDSAIATGDGDLFSFLSEFGTAPPGGFDDTDRSDVQGVGSRATFHSGEVNYRRRTVGPYGRFQWSWLGGLRYLRFDNGFDYFAQGDNGFFTFDNLAQNEMFGTQIGGDLWWNVIPGVNFGLGAKGGPMGNRIKRQSWVTASSIGPGGAPGGASAIEQRSRTSWMAELEATMLYRISHSWTLKSQGYLLTVDQVGYGFDPGAADSLLNGAAMNGIDTRALTIRGFAWGLEYIW